MHRAHTFLTVMLVLLTLCGTAFVLTAVHDVREDAARCASMVVTLPTDGSPIVGCTDITITRL